VNKIPSEINLVNISAIVGRQDSVNGNYSEQNLPNSGLCSLKILRNIKALIFDFDGTLFDNTKIAFNLISLFPPDILRIWKERKTRKHFAGCHFSSSEEYYRMFFAVLAKSCYRSPAKIEKWYFNRYMPRMIRVLKKHYTLRPGVKELFALFDSTSKIHVAVYSDYPRLKERLKVLGLNVSPKIKLYGPESFGAQKPAPEPFLSIASDLGSLPEETLVIGDREETDGLGAFRAGMRFFCLETGRRRHFQLDPNRRLEKETPHGPSLVMYAGIWEDLYKLLIKQFG